MITVMTDSEDERMDVLDSFLYCLGGAVPFQVLVQDRITDWYPSGHAGANVRTP